MSEFARELADLVNVLAHDIDARADGPAGSPSTHTWKQVCELGLAGIGIAEERGGSGGSLPDLMVVIRELARAGIGTPIVEASTAAYAIGQVPTDTFDIIAVERDLLFASDTLTASFIGVPFAADGRRLAIVTASSILAVPLVQNGVTVEAGRDIAELPRGSIHLENASFATASAGPAAPEVIDRLAVARSSALIGSAWGAYELTRDYVTQRQQFGAPLIKIPAVSSALAQMVVRIRFAQSALDRAVSLSANAAIPPVQRSGAVAAARIASADTATLVARSAHQLHGAVGFTDEYPLHRYTKKLWAWRDADESQRAHCARLGATVRMAGEIALWERISA